MTPVFADTFYFLAILNAKDQAHQQAVEYSQTRTVPLVSTAWVLTELADALSRSSHRQVFRRVVNDLRSDPETIIVPPSQSLFEKGVERYDSRPDKNWSLTDCISFVVMEEHGITDALSGDHHFEQAGFTILLEGPAT